MRAAFATTLALLLLTSCTKKEVRKVRTEPWLATPSASAADAPTTPRRYRLAADSRATFTLPGKKASLRGQVPIVAGELMLDAGDVTRSKAWAEADLTQLSIEPSSLSGKTLPLEGDVNTWARRWLELGASVPERRRLEFSRARFELASVEAAGRATSAGAEGRSDFELRLVAVGTLQLHGFRVPVRVPLTLTSRNAGVPSPLTIRSRNPLVLNLEAHDVAARDDAGRLAPLISKQLAPYVGRAAHVSLELTAEPQP